MSQSHTAILLLLARKGDTQPALELILGSSCLLVNLIPYRLSIYYTVLNGEIRVRQTEQLSQVI